MSIPLPGYVDKEAWDALIDMRRAKRVPTTDYAAKLLLYELQRIKDAGYDPNAALHQSIVKGYTDVYPPKDKPIERKAGLTGPDPELQRLNERARTATKPPPGLRRVA